MVSPTAIDLSVELDLGQLVGNFSYCGLLIQNVAVVNKLHLSDLLEFLVLVPSNLRSLLADKLNLLLLLKIQSFGHLVLLDLPE